LRALLLALALLGQPAAAADIYRWVDEDGKVHISDVVPEKYRASAKRIDTGPSEVSPENRAAAEARAAADRERAKASAAAAQQRAIQHPDPIAAPKPPPETDCERAHRLYKESIDCFAPFVTTQGSVKAEAFNFCTSLPDPSPRCGPPKPESSER
jgi:hypothetical protein